MNKNVDLTVRKVHGAYCVQLTRALAAPQLYWSEEPYGEKLHLIGPMQGQEMWIPSPAQDRRVYFCVKAEENTVLWAGDTAVEIGAVENFRDMGGYRTRDGRTVKWGRFFRCGAVRGMDAREMKIYRGMHIHSIFDYRATEESAAEPDVYTEETAYHLVPAIAVTGQANELADMDMVSQLKKIHTAEDADKMYGMFLSLYGSLPFHNDAYKAMFAALDSHETVPLIQHCSAGKDRTGVGCALLLLALGVEEETVMEDYLLSAVFREAVNQQYVDKMAQAGLNQHALDLVARMMTVTRDMLAHSFGEIKKRYPDFETFLEAEYGVTPRRRANWVQLHTV